MARIRLTAGQVDPKKPQATSVTGPAQPLHPASAVNVRKSTKTNPVKETEILEQALEEAVLFDLGSKKGSYSFHTVAEPEVHIEKSDSRQASYAIWSADHENTITNKYGVTGHFVIEDLPLEELKEAVEWLRETVEDFKSN